MDSTLQKFKVNIMESDLGESIQVELDIGVEKNEELSKELS